MTRLPLIFLAVLACAETPDPKGDTSAALDTDSADSADSAETADDTDAINTAPTCAITAPEDGARFVPGEGIAFAAAVGDAESAPEALALRWSSDLDGLLNADPADANGAASFSSADLLEGRHEIRLWVADEAGETCADSVVLRVGAGPEVEITAPTDGARAQQGELLDFAATVVSETSEAEDLTLRWISDLDGTLDSSPADSDGEVAISLGDLSGGLHVIVLSATDAFGETGEDSILLTINGWPGAPEVSISPDPAAETSDLTAILDVPSVDPEGAEVSYTYAWTRNGADTSYTTSVVPASATASGDTWTVTVTPNDGEIDGPAGTASVTMGNEAPVLSAVTLTPDPAYEGDTLTCTPGSASDAEGDSISYSYAWMVDGAAVSSTSSTLGSADFARDQIVVCTVTPSDGESAGDPVSDSVTIGNTAPELSSVTLSPDPAYEGDTLSCTPGTTTDVDGDSLSYTYAWTVAGSSPGVTTSTLSSEYFGKGNAVRCTATPSDGTASGAAVSSSALTISNSKPVLSTVSISPDAPTTDSTLSLSFSASDADSDTITYTYLWKVDSSSVSIATTLAGSAFDKGDVVSVTVTPFDGSTSGTAGTASVTIGNTAPEAPSVEISPSLPDAGGDDLLCEVVTDSTDADRDDITYTVSWEADGLPYPSGFSRPTGPLTTEWTDDTVPAADTELATSWTCTVTPDDGETEGSEGSASVDVYAFYHIGNDAELERTATTSASYLLGTTVLVKDATTLYQMGVVMATGGVKVQMALYTDSGSRPSTLVAYTTLDTTVAGENEYDVTSPVALPEGTYWLMAAYTATGNPTYTTSTSKTVAYKSYTAGSTPTSSFGSSSTYCCQDFSYYLVVAD